MRIRVKVYDSNGAVHKRLDLIALDRDSIAQVTADVDEFFKEQYEEIKELEEV